MTTIIALPDLHGEVQNLERIAEQLRKGYAFVEIVDGKVLALEIRAI